MAARRPLLIRPALWVILHAIAWMVLVSPLAVSLMDDASNAPAAGVLAWWFVWIPGAALSAVVGHLAARLERATEGARRPQGYLWLVHALGAGLVGHYALMGLWAPYLFARNALRGYPLDDLGDVLSAALAWIPLLVAVGIVLWTARALRRRTEGRIPDLPLVGARVPSMVIAGLTLALPLAIGGFAVGAGVADLAAWDPEEASIALGAWIAVTAVVSLGAALAWSRVRRALARHPGAVTKSGPLERVTGAWGLAGGLLLAQWLPVYLVALAPGPWSGATGWEYGVALLSLALVLDGLWLLSPVWVPRKVLVADR